MNESIVNKLASSSYGYSSANGGFGLLVPSD